MSAFPDCVGTSDNSYGMDGPCIEWARSHRTVVSLDPLPPVEMMGLLRGEKYR